ncbi:SMI1/KNR4 family protein [Kitasatospora sp. NPDC051853]|uniref:SMI1/KNR4 family protein n=1 Tax=Kitasatospora sp. NPDC051853 TaxID=3364058 RepID=UPI0037B6E21E
MDATVERTARRITAEVNAAAPPGWSAYVLRAETSYRGSRIRGGYRVPGRPDVPFPAPLTPERLDALATAFRRAHEDWFGIALELTCRPSGTFELVVFQETVQLGATTEDGWTMTLHHGHRPAEPGILRGTGPAGLPPAGDPAEAVARMRSLLRLHAERTGERPRLPAGLTEEELATVERRLDRKLPADLRAMYREADGDDGAMAFAGCAWLCVEDALAERNEDTSSPKWLGWRDSWRWTVLEADPPDTVRRASGYTGWLPFATALEGNFYAVDLEPDTDGHHGQVIEIGRDFRHRPRYVAPSVTEWLGQALGLTAPPPTPADPTVRHLDGGPLPPHVQAVHLDDAPSPVDLAPLSTAVRLHRLHLTGCTTADLSPLAALPLNDLALGLAPGTGLAPLTGHPHLATLSLDSASPVDLGPLRTLPALRGLDLTRCPGTDLTLLAELPALRYLALTTAQWSALAAAGRLPTRLAAVRLAGTPPLGHALALLAALGTDTSTAHRLTGP